MEPVISPQQPTVVTPQQTQAQVTPVNSPPSDVQYAGFGVRFGAIFIDGLILVVIGIVLNIILSFGGLAEVSISSSGFSTRSSGLPSLFLFAVDIAYFVYLTSKTGQTLGKKVLKIKVVKKVDTVVPGMTSVLLRETVGRFLSSGFFLLGYLWVIWDKEKQGWHDKIAGTVVVKV